METVPILCFVKILSITPSGDPGVVGRVGTKRFQARADVVRAPPPVLSRAVICLDPTGILPLGLRGLFFPESLLYFHFVSF